MRSRRGRHYLAAAVASLYAYDLYKSIPDLFSGATRGKLQANNAAPVLHVTIGWVALYMSFLSYQAQSKFNAFSALKKEIKAADGNSPSFEEVKYGSASKMHLP